MSASSTAVPLEVCPTSDCRRWTVRACSPPLKAEHTNTPGSGRWDVAPGSAGELRPGLGPIRIDEAMGVLRRGQEVFGGQDRVDVRLGTHRSRVSCVA